MPGILWLASYPKSGNTWVRAFLANLLADRREPLPINDLPKFILGDNFLEHYARYSGKEVAALTPELIEALRPKVHQWFAHSRPDNAVVKTHSALIKVNGKPLITPGATAGAIYVVRNPLDVAVSLASHYQVETGRAVEILCDEQHVLPPSSGLTAQYLGSWSRHVRSWTRAPGLPLHLMRYEDMQRRPEREFAALMAFLGLPKDPARLKKAIKFSSFRELAGQEKQTKFVESRPDGKAPFFREGRTGAWRDALTESQVARLTEAHGEVMAEFKYLTPEGKVAA